jgi:hypothetical protein
MRNGWPTNEDFVPVYELIDEVRPRLLTELDIRHTTLREWMGEALKTIGGAIPHLDNALSEPVGAELRQRMAADFAALAAIFLESAMTVQFGHSTTPPWDTPEEEMKTRAGMMFAPELSKETPALLLPSLVVKIGEILLYGDRPLPGEIDQLGGDEALANHEHQIALFGKLAGCLVLALVLAVATAGGLDELHAAVPPAWHH